MNQKRTTPKSKYPLGNGNEQITQAFAKAGLPLWVTPREAHGLLIARRYSESVADELAGWLARRMSMSFAAGYLSHKALPISGQDVQRQLVKMGYCQPNAEEIAGLLQELHPALFSKGLGRSKPYSLPCES